MSYRVYEKNGRPLEIFGVVVDCPTLKDAIELEEDIAYTLLRFTDVDIDVLEIWKVTSDGHPIERCN